LIKTRLLILWFHFFTIW